MPSKPNIVIIENASDVTGGLTSIVRSCMALREKFHFTFILPSGSAAVSYVEANHFEVQLLSMKEIRKNVSSIVTYFPILISNALKLRSIIDHSGAQLIVSNDLYNLIPPIYKLLGGKVPYIVYARFLPSKFPSLLVAMWRYWHVRFASTTVAVSKQVQEELAYSKNVVQIYGELPPWDVPFKKPSGRTILYLSNFIRGKGQNFALESFGIVSIRHPEWKLRFVGGVMGMTKNRKFKNALVQRSKELNLTHAVEWEEFRTDVESEYLDCAFSVNFSESESFSLTCLESMYCGRPVIVTRCGGPEEIVDDQVNGLLVDIGNIPQMVDAFEQMITKTERREDMGESAYKHVRNKFSAKNTIEKLGELYQLSLLK